MRNWRAGLTTKKHGVRKGPRHYLDYRRRNRKRLNEYSRVYYLANKEERAAYEKKWRKANRDRIVARRAKRRAAHPELMLMENHRRRATRIDRLRSREPMRADQIMGLLKVQNHRCASPACSKVLRRANRSLDHKKPLSRGGSNRVTNLQWLCRPCNSSKGNKTMAEWLT